MYAVDMHTHTEHYSSCGHQTIHELIEAAANKGLHAVCVTEHHHRWSDEELARAVEEVGVGGELVVLAGEEISCYSPKGVRQGDYLVYGLESSIGDRMDVYALIEMVHERGGIVVAAHPFREGYGSAELMWHLQVDAIEVFNKAHTPENERQAWECAQSRGIVMVGNSDAHRPEHVGMNVTYFAEPVRSIEDLVRQVREGKVSIEVPRLVRMAAGG